MEKTVCIITRTGEKAAQTAQAVEQKGYLPVIAPVLSVELFNETVPGQNVDAVVFTSMNGLRGLHKDAQTRLKNRLCFCVGETTAAEAMDAGFTNVVAGRKGAEQLGKRIVSEMRGTGSKLLYIRGRDVSFDMTGFLRANKLDVTETVTYKTEQKPNLPAPFEIVLKSAEPAAILVYSVKTAQTIVSLVQKAGLQENCTNHCVYTLSEKISGAFSPIKWQTVQNANRAAEDALLDLLPDCGA